MPLRIIEIVVPLSATTILDELPSASSLHGRWDVPLGDGRMISRMLVDAKLVEGMLDDLQSRFSKDDGYRVMLFSVEATLPKIEEAANGDPPLTKSTGRISREELFDDVSHSAEISNVFMLQVVLATLVAAVGLMRNDTAILV